MWNPNEHPDADNMRWCDLRAMEWALWPIFISQPVAPVALLFVPWWIVALVTLVAAGFWALFVRHTLVIPLLALWGALFVRLKWITCPVAAGVLAYRGQVTLALLALFWPILALFLPFVLVPFGPARLCDIEKLFMRCLSYEPAAKD